jgi:hypothetical protein
MNIKKASKCLGLSFKITELSKIKQISYIILVNDQLDALFFNVFISCLYMFRATSAHHQEDQLVSIHQLVQLDPPDDEHLLLETCRGMK